MTGINKYIQFMGLFLLLTQTGCSDQKVVQNVRIVNEVSSDTHNASNTSSITVAPLVQSGSPSLNTAANENNSLLLHKVSLLDTVGNGDKRINRGETIEFTPVFQNRSKSATNTMYLRITCFHSQVTPINPLQTGVKVKPIPADEVVEVLANRNSPQIRLDSQIQAGTQIEVLFKLIDTEKGQTYNFPYLITVQS